MKALVTGATGFVGTHLVAALCRAGDEVTALVRSPGRASVLEGLKYRTVSGDLDGDRALAEAVSGQDVIYHAAALVAARNETEFFRVNRGGTGRLLNAAAASGTPRFVLVSSLAAGGPTQPGRPLKGGEPSHPVTAYGRSKLAAEEEVRSGKLPWTIVRPPTVYGPRDREVLKVFRMARSGIVPVLGSGNQHLSAIYAPDLAEALVRIGHTPEAAGQMFYASHPEVITSRELVQTIGRAVNRKVRIVPIPEFAGRAMLHLTGAAARMAGRATILNPDKANEFFQRAWTCDPAALTAVTGWTAGHDLTSGVCATADWYR
ncbi:MAG: NAD-dependent epimerase/dehydratase family protein, partial [Gemmatimonadales bacterium]